jgi:hypothetical protein
VWRDSLNLSAAVVDWTFHGTLTDLKRRRRRSKQNKKRHQPFVVGGSPLGETGGAVCGASRLLPTDQYSRRREERKEGTNRKEGLTFTALKK